MPLALPISAETPDPNSVAIMQAIDSLSKPMRALVREFGWVIVRDMRDEGYTNARELRCVLETWRERRQEVWLATDHINRRTVESIVNSAMRRARQARKSIKVAWGA